MKMMKLVVDLRLKTMTTYSKLRVKGMIAARNSVVSTLRKNSAFLGSQTVRDPKKWGFKLWGWSSWFCNQKRSKSTWIYFLFIYLESGDVSSWVWGCTPPGSELQPTAAVSLWSGHSWRHHGKRFFEPGDAGGAQSRSSCNNLLNRNWINYDQLKWWWFFFCTAKDVWKLGPGPPQWNRHGPAGTLRGFSCRCWWFVSLSFRAVGDGDDFEAVAFGVQVRIGPLILLFFGIKKKIEVFTVFWWRLKKQVVNSFHWICDWYVTVFWAFIQIQVDQADFSIENQGSPGKSLQGVGIVSENL